MASWLAAQIVHKEHELVSMHIKRVGFRSFYPRWRRTVRRTPEVGALYPGYIFVGPGRLPAPEDLWYSILECCSAVVAIVAMASELKPLTSLSMDAHVERLMCSVDRDGFVPAPKDRRNSFLRGDRVRVENKFFTGPARFVQLKRDGGVEVTAEGGRLPFTVDESEVSYA